MVKAQKRDAVRQGEFYFRKNLKNSGSFCVRKSDTGKEAENCRNDEQHHGREFEFMSIDRIINGKDGEFPGLIPLINRYLVTVEIDLNTHCTLSQYLNLISKRASGELLTTAQWIRRFVESHRDYKRDSVVGEIICYDLLRKIDRLGQGEAGAPELLGEFARMDDTAI